MHVHELERVAGSIVFDFPPDVAGVSAGGTRLAHDVTVDEIALLARAMTYKFAVFGRRLGGAKAGIKPLMLGSHDDTMAAYCEEIRPLVEAHTFLTGADLGTSDKDFVSLNGSTDVFATEIDGVPFEEVVTGHGVVAAADAWLRGIAGASFAIEGFGKVGGGVARAAVARGARLLGVSTIHGAVADPEGFDLDELLAARAAHGDTFVEHLGATVRPPDDLFRLKVDVLVPGARIGALSSMVARRVRARVVAPAANVPYSEAGLQALRANRVAALPDFVCNAGAVLAYEAPAGLTPEEVLARVERLIGEQITAARDAGVDPFDAAVTAADTFLATWIPVEHLPDGPAFADD